MTLDTFEQGLLTELRHHVAARSTAPVRRRRKRWIAVPIAAAGAAVAVGVAMLQPTAAYAVTESGDQVVVTISRLDDADGLERALADHGIEADVDYSANAPLPPGEGSTHTESGTSDEGPGVSSGGAGETPPAGAVPSISTSMSEDAFTLRLDPDTIPDGTVLHITTSGSLDDGISGLQVAFTPAD